MNSSENSDATFTGEVEQEVKQDELDMLYPEFVERAMNSQEPVTRIDECGEYRTRYESAQYDPNEEIVWRCSITYDSHPENDSEPSVEFNRAMPKAEVNTLQKWSSVATGRLSGPQKLGSWESMFTVFNAALGLFNREVRFDD